MKRPKTNSKKISWFGIVSVFMLAIALAVGVSTNAQAATGSFDRNNYFPSLSDSNDFDRAFISVTDATITTANTDTISVTVKAGANEASFVLRETGGTTSVFTTSGSSQPVKTAVGSTTGYVEDFSGNHNYPGLATGITGLKLKSGGISTSGDATIPTDGELKVSSGNTLELIYSGSTLDTAVVGFNGANNSTITFIKESTWGNSITGSADSESASVTISVNDPDENLNPKVKDVIGFQNGFTAGLTGTGSSRVQIEAIDQTTGSTLTIISDVVTRNITLVETGANTGIFSASGKVYGSTTATLQGNVTTGTATTAVYTGATVTLGTTTADDALVTVKVLGANANGSLVLYNANGNTSTARTALAFTTGTTVPGSSTILTELDIVAIGTRTSTWDGTNHGTSTAYGSAADSQGLVKLFDGNNNFCIVNIVTFKGSSTAAAANVWSGPTAAITGANVVPAGTRSVSIGSFVLTGPRSGDTIKVSYLDELTSSGAAGTVTSATAFGATGETGVLSVSATTVDINDFISITVVDGNLNSNEASKESMASGTWGGTTTNSRGDRLSVKAYSRTGISGIGSNTVSISHPDGSRIGTQTVRISNTDNSLVWVVPTSGSGVTVSGFGDPTGGVGSATFSLGTRSTSAIPLVKGTSATADSFLASASTASFVITSDAVDSTVEISPDGTYWIAIPVVETGVNSSTFVGTIGFDTTAARITTSTTRTAALTFSDFTGTTTITFDSTITSNLTSDVGTGSVVRVSDGTFSEVREVTGVTGTTLSVTKLSNSSFFTPWKTWVQVVGNDMSTDRADTVSGTSLFRIGGFYGATYRIRYNDALNASGAYAGGDTLAVTTSNVGFQTNTGSLSVSPSGTVGLNSQIEVTLVDNDLNISTASAQSTFNDTSSIANLNEVGLGNPAGTSSGNTLFRNGGIAKQIFASRVSSITSTDFASTSNTVSLKLTETGANSGTFLGTLKLTGVTGSSTDNTLSPPALKVSNGDTITVFYNDSPSATAENNLSAYTTVSVVGAGGVGSLSLSKSEAFLSGDTVVATLSDNDLNTTSGLDTGIVKAKSSSDDTTTNGISVTVTETATNSGTFKGTFTTGAASVEGTDVVRAVANGNITVTYSDSSPAADITAQVSTKNFGAVLAFTSDPVAIDGNAVVSLYDPETNTSISSQNLVNVGIKSTIDSSGTTLRLTETGNDTGSFLGTIAVSSDSSLINTRIKAAVGNTLTATFTDSPNATGGISTVTGTATVGAAAATPTPTPTATPVTSPTATPTVVPSPTVVPTPSGGVIAGTVVDALTTAPIAGATISTDTGGYTATTGPDGSYRIDNVAAGAYLVTASATGFDSSSQPVTVVEGVVSEANFSLVPTILPTPTPTPTVTPTPVCDEPEAISVSPTSLTLKRKKSGDVTVTVTCGDDEGLEGQDVKATINAAGKKRISISPTSDTTDASGAATFKITAKKKTGSARVTFKAGSVKKSMTVKVRK